MSKVILQISYDVRADQRDAYLALAKELRAYFSGERKKNYSLFEVKGRQNSFVEQFVCASPEEYDALEDDASERAEELVNRLELLKEGKTKYLTLVEAD